MREGTGRAHGGGEDGPGEGWGAGWGREYSILGAKGGRTWTEVCRGSGRVAGGPRGGKGVCRGHVLGESWLTVFSALLTAPLWGACATLRADIGFHVSGGLQGVQPAACGGAGDRPGLLGCHGPQRQGELCG